MSLTELVDVLNPTEAELTDRMVERELKEDYALPELADSLEEAEARGRASTFLRVLGHVQKEQEANKAELATLIEFYTEQHYTRQEKLDRQIAWLKESLEGLFGMMDKGKKKSLNLLGGTVGHRAQQDELVVKDDEAVVGWVREYGQRQLVQTKFEVNRTELRKLMESKSGLHPYGVQLVERPPVFYARPK